ncbi:Aste57867_4073 [Aphanomyces stellatus]|uniref:Aste57867_4073 protein n=1 Tax=Aphanomyces stellatus TaxID=120398 RepID=A0A485KEV4_9STRA|nr:hypothetical protein As57867_004062 [Aphanomyces stellatus]VFT81207.1 Aste57867_4073 [Aphanomyces stellatus]
MMSVSVVDVSPFYMVDDREVEVLEWDVVDFPHLLQTTEWDLSLCHVDIRHLRRIAPTNLVGAAAAILTHKFAAMATLEAIDCALEARLAANQQMQDELEEMEARILAFLKETDMSLFPAVEQVSCKCVPEHFVPPTALGRHLKRVHGMDDETPQTSHKFFYRRGPENTHRPPPPPPDELLVEVPHIDFKPMADPTANFVDLPFDEGATDVSFDVEEMQSIVDVAHAGHTNLSFNDAAVAVASTPEEFFQHVMAWRKIPAHFAKVNVINMPRVKSWVEAWLTKEKQEADADLVEFILGLVDHPDYCLPDLIVAELHEFLSTDTARFVLALWGFLVVEMALAVCFVRPRDDHDTHLRIQTNAPCTYDTLVKNPLREAQTRPPPPSKPSTDGLPPANKRRRTSFREKKLARKTPRQTMRDLVANQMLTLGQAEGWTVVAADTGDDDADADDERDKSARADERERRKKQDELMQMRDPLAVRDLARRPASSRKRDRSRSRSQERRQPRYHSHRSRSRERSVRPRHHHHHYDRRPTS